MNCIPSAALTGALLVVVGCGPVSRSEDLGGQSSDAAPLQFPDLGPTMVQMPQMPPIQMPPVADLGLVQNKLAFDAAPPPKPGGACPCPTSLVCVSGSCRLPCTTPTDPCKVVSSCPDDQTCQLSKGSGAWACLPAAKPGASCNSSVNCPNKHVCASVSGKSFNCLPVCSKLNAACGSGGSCVAAVWGCSFCTKAN